MALVIHALISGVTRKPLSRFQCFQDGAARPLTGFNRQHPITPVLACLRWLPLHFRTDFKTFTDLLLCEDTRHFMFTSSTLSS